MAVRSKRAQESARKAGEAAASLRSNPYVQRLIEDDELRANIREAFESARDAYTRIANGKGPAKALMDDKKVQRDLRQAAESMREASEQLRGRRTKRKSRLGRLLLIALIGAGLALLLSEDLRKALLDRLFGAEEEFEYTSTTSPAPETATTQSS
jgi:CHASE3 domain sensor protein